MLHRQGFPGREAPPRMLHGQFCKGAERRLAAQALVAQGVIPDQPGLFPGEAAQTLGGEVKRPVGYA
ncbi:hypothetical protein D3C85_1942320 [compost metagenome]